MRGSVPPTMRIGELAAKVGVSTHVLRAWESRYGLLRPVRSAGGYRLYGHEDERRVREVIALRDQGVSAVEAARRVLAAERAGSSPSRARPSTRPPRRHRRPATGRPADGAGTGRPAARARHPTPRHWRAPAGLRADPQMLVAQLLDAVTALDEDRAHAVLDTAFARALGRERHRRRPAPALRPGRRDVGARPDRHRAGALREQPRAPPPRGAVADLGRRHRTGRRARLSPGRVPRHRPAELRRAPRSRRVARPLPRPRHPHPLPGGRGPDDPGGCRGARLPPPLRVPRARHAAAPPRRGPPGVARRPQARPRGCSRRSGWPQLGGDLVAAVAALTATARERRAARPRSRTGTATEPSGAEGGAGPTA